MDFISSTVANYPTKPIVSNIEFDSFDGLGDGERANLQEMTDQIIDGRQMDQIPDGSLGAVLMAHLSFAELDSSEDVWDRIDRVHELTKQTADTGTIPAELMELSQRL